MKGRKSLFQPRNKTSALHLRRSGYMSIFGTLMVAREKRIKKHTTQLKKNKDYNRPFPQEEI